MSEAGGQEMKAIINGDVWTITNGVIHNGQILIDGGKIKAVGKNLEIPTDTQVFDVSGKVVMPGLIDAHTHVGIFNDGVGGGHSDGNETTDPITPHLRALDAVHPEDIAFQDLVEAGITTVLTGPGSANLIGGQWICVKTVPTPNIDEMILKEPAGMKLALGENPRRVYGSQKRIPSTRMGNAALLRSALVDAQNYLTKWAHYEADLAEYHAGKTETRDKEPKRPERNLKFEALGKLLSRELKARIHAHRADDILTAIRIAEEFNLDLTIEHATEGYKIAHILAEKNIPVTVGPIFTSRYKYELRDRTPTNPGILAKAGVKVAIQTDQMSAVKYLTINAALAVREGMPEEEAIKAITINAAEIIGVADRIGSLEVGKDANISVFNGHPFDYMTKADLVFVDGNLVYQRDLG
jgi:imidazolonepropionase-like amidohydrolase